MKWKAFSIILNSLSSKQISPYFSNGERATLNDPKFAKFNWEIFKYSKNL